jgi:hypothetical protein
MTATFRVTKGTFKCVKKWGSKRIDKNRLLEFWEDVASGNRRGVYIFGIRAGKGFRPLYVGRTIDQTLKKRVQQHLDSGKFDRMLREYKKATPILFLLSREGKGRKSTSAIDELEIEFINYAFDRNNDLHNDRLIRTPKYVVQGFGRGRPSAAVQDLKKIIGW